VEEGVMGTRASFATWLIRVVELVHVRSASFFFVTLFYPESPAFYTFVLAEVLAIAQTVFAYMALFCLYY